MRRLRVDINLSPSKAPGIHNRKMQNTVRRLTFAINELYLNGKEMAMYLFIIIATGDNGSDDKLRSRAMHQYEVVGRVT